MNAPDSFLARRTQVALLLAAVATATACGGDETNTRTPDAGEADQGSAFNAAPLSPGGGGLADQPAPTTAFDFHSEEGSALTTILSSKGIELKTTNGVPVAYLANNTVRITRAWFNFHAALRYDRDQQKEHSVILLAKAAPRHLDNNPCNATDGHLIFYRADTTRLASDQSPYIWHEQHGLIDFYDMCKTHLYLPATKAAWRMAINDALQNVVMPKVDAISGQAIINAVGVVLGSINLIFSFPGASAVLPCEATAIKMITGFGAAEAARWKATFAHTSFESGVYGAAAFVALGKSYTDLLTGAPKCIKYVIDNCAAFPNACSTFQGEAVGSAQAVILSLAAIFGVDAVGTFATVYKTLPIWPGATQPTQVRTHNSSIPPLIRD